MEVPVQVQRTTALRRIFRLKKRVYFLLLPSQLVVFCFLSFKLQPQFAV